MKPRLLSAAMAAAMIPSIRRPWLTWMVVDDKRLVDVPLNHRGFPLTDADRIAMAKARAKRERRKAKKDGRTPQ